MRSGRSSNFDRRAKPLTACNVFIRVWVSLPCTSRPVAVAAVYRRSRSSLIDPFRSAVVIVTVRVLLTDHTVADAHAYSSTKQAYLGAIYRSGPRLGSLCHDGSAGGDMARPTATGEEHPQVAITLFFRPPRSQPQSLGYNELSSRFRK